MLKENKNKVILSSIITLLPVIFGLIVWDSLPEYLSSHWSDQGTGSGLWVKALFVFGVPLILLVSHLLCLLFTLQDNKQKGQNKKALGILFWINPFICLFSCSIFYAAAFGKTFDFDLIFPIVFGIIFIVIGNYLPKIKQNRSLGIKLPWTLFNEENWNKTHRFGGKVWVICGLIMLFSIFLPSTAMVFVFVSAIIAMALVPTIYSYCLYKKHLKEGIVYAAPPKSKAEKIALRISAIVVPVILIGVGILMFTGNIAVSCDDSSFQIQADYWTDLKVDYSEIDSISYCEDFDAGRRTNGFGSAKLAMGLFQNQEFGTYTLYAYTKAEDFIVLTSGEKILVIGLKTPEETKELYRQLSEYTENRR